MSTEAINQLTADAALTARLANAKTPQELSDILHESLERANIAHRDLATGRFVRTEQEAAAVVPAAAAAAPHEFKKTEVIAGTSFEFTASSEAELTRQILDANRIAATFAEANRSERASRTVQQDAMDRVDADLALRRGEISTAEYLQRTHAIEDALAARGVDLNTISAGQFAQSWAQATESFKTNTEEGRTWRGGNKNLEIAASLMQSHGWENGINGDKVAALQAVAAEMREKGLEFDGDHTPEEIEALTAKATPAEILQAWKEANSADLQNPEAANENFIATFRNGRSSGIFGS